MAACERLSTEPCWDWDLVPAYFQRIAGGAVAGQQVNGELWELGGDLWIVALAVGLLALLWAALRDSRTRLLVPLLVLTSAGLFLASGYQRWGAGGVNFLWPDGEFREGSHYLITPTLLLLTAILLQLDGARSALAVAAAAFIVTASAIGFGVGDPAIRGAVSWSERVAAAKAECAPSTAPESVTISTGRVFDYPITVPCEKLR